MISISNRLHVIAKQVKQGSRIADIGSDHALLPSYLAEQGIVTFAVAGELNPGPLQAAKEQVNKLGLQHIIDVRNGNGLEVIKPGEVDTITIAGMGGGLIAEILDQGKDKLQGVERLILQPNVAEGTVRSWLLKHHWHITTETIMEEDQHIYEVICAEQSDQSDALNEQLYTELKLQEDFSIEKEKLLQFGPLLIRSPLQVFFIKWEKEIQKLDKILSKLSQSSLQSSRLKEQELHEEIRIIREVLTCLQTDRL